MESEWHKIISFNGSQANAFEEIVCQIALGEKAPQFVNFERVGTPDGGVECYWQLVDGSEWGWQAKYYDQIAAREWEGIRKSLFDAAETHPKLVRYYVGIPHNLSDGRRGKRTQKDKWETYKAQWTSELNNTGRNIELILWNSTILFSKLSAPHLKGTFDLFFGNTAVDEEQMYTHLEAAIKSLGPKYSATLNLQIQGITKPFDGLGRNSRFINSFYEQFDGLLIKLDITLKVYHHYGTKFTTRRELLMVV